MSFRLAALATFSLCAPLAAVDTWVVDPGHSTAMFKVLHFGAGHIYGRFNDLAGTVDFDAADATKNKVSVTIKTESVDSALPNRDDHLRGTDFFNAKQFPTMTFASKEWKPAGDKKWDVTGTLTIKGISKEITIPVVLIGTGVHALTQKNLAGFEATFSVKRSDFGLNYMPGALGEDVAVVLALEAVK